MVAEDDPTVSGVLLAYLHRAGFDAFVCEDGPGALAEWSRRRPDVVILDIMLPGMSGLDVLRRRRADDDTAAVMILSALGDEDDRLLGLDLGADDYMVKPFSSAHLDARVATVLRRTGRASRADPVIIDAGGLRLDSGERKAYLDGTALSLTRKEFDLLAYLAARPGRVVSRRELLEEVWRQPSIGEDQTIDVHLYWLRRKLGESAAEPRFLHTVRGVGIRFAVPD
jgi:DNA-binding response OmpR family regulator